MGTISKYPTHPGRRSRWTTHAQHQLAGPRYHQVAAFFLNRYRFRMRLGQLLLPYYVA